MEMDRPVNPAAWLYFAILACATTTVMVLTMKYVGTQLATDAAEADDRLYLLAMCSFCTLVLVGILGLCALAACKYYRPSFFSSVHARMKRTPWLVAALACVAVMILITQFSLLASVNLSSNPAYAHIVVNFNVILVLLGSIFLFQCKVHWIAVLGIFLGVLGISLVGFGHGSRHKSA